MEYVGQPIKVQETETHQKVAEIFDPRTAKEANPRGERLPRFCHADNVLHDRDEI